MYRYLLLIGVLCLIVLLVWCCDFAFKHLLWRFIGHRQALWVRSIATILVWSGIGLSLFYGYHRGRFLLEIKPIELRSKHIPSSFEGYRIAQISDLHLHSFNSPRGKAFLKMAFDSLLAQKPDLIVFTGDLVTYEAQEAETFRPLLAHLAQQGIPVLSIMGNHDYADYTTKTLRQQMADRAHLRRLQAECGWKLLDNESLDIVRGADRLHIIGVENIGEPPFTTYGSLSKAMAGQLKPNDPPFSILLSHNPIHWRQEVLPHTQINLTLSGHTHAMQFRLFGWSPVSWKYKEWGGLYSENGRWLYVNTGLGCTGPAVRIGVPPEITLFTLHHSPTR